MRGLTDAEPSGGGAVRAAFTAVAVLVALGLFASACATGGTGARDEGPAHADSVAGAAVSPSPSGAAARGQVDAVRLVKDDPTVSTEVKRALKPCVADEYPVDVSYGELTGGPADDVVVNVLTCGDAVGVGSYVYRQVRGKYENVFETEEPPVYAEIDRGDLVVTKQVYEKGDPVSSPSGENVITYRWASGRFAEEYRTHNDYSNAVGGAATPVPSG
ncbi:MULTISPECIES: hypothetical protein [Streptomyces]|uniref:Lipoprotein CseA n=1 Tax=Streptomyces doudnae TaxID=3075536 RepID=A0ABD5EZM2_9ACTN|nr:MULTISPECIES: hypothetical protein [unclassified Streptomyces]MDT0439819.1 hypothetical protein [Streptomyces sp. DSM 41981]SCE28352.1 hypothetical protein GA0115242_12863 [Streptomyces sp. SolWspMP-5a-2]